METKQVKALLEKYYAGESTLEEERQLHTFFQQSKDLGDLETHRSAFLIPEVFQYEQLPMDFKAQIMEQYASPTKELWSWVPNRQTLQIAASILLLISSFLLGRLSNPKSGLGNTEVAGLQAEINDLQLLTAEILLRQPKASERLQGVEILSQLSLNQSQGHYDLIFKALNEDQNPNVRLATLNVLYQLEQAPELKRQLYQSLLIQESPILQLELLQLLQQLGISLNNRELDELIQKGNLDQDVQNVLQEKYKL